MMSKHFFFRILKEDLRHRTWMIALSFLASFLALPVSWLIMRSNMGSFDLEGGAIVQIYDFFKGYMMLGCGIVAVVGAFITGLFGFRHVFQKRMVDTWHSLPVKRSVLFGAFYLNGVLIWFVPFALNILFTIAMSAGPVCSLAGAAVFGGILKEILGSLAVLMVVYLLVYHTVLVAVMLSGNVLNTLAGMGIGGFGVFCFYGVIIMLLSYNMQTFVEPDMTKNVVYASPLFSAVYLLYTRADLGADFWGWGNTFLLVNLLIAAALGLCAGWLYYRRDSETAEQGIRSRAVGSLLRVLAGVMAGMCGWQLLVVMVGNSWTAVWGCFGAVFLGILVFGGLDIVIHMDFKAFFAHKLQMGLTVAAALLICFSLWGDWFSYDTYLPKKEEVAGIAVFNAGLGNRYSYAQARDIVLETMNYQETENIFAYLENAVEKEELPEEEYLEKYGNQDFEYVNTKVTLKNGRSYYRCYRIAEKDSELMWKLFSDEECLKYAYCIGREEAESFSSIAFSRNERRAVSGDVSAEVISSIVQAYNEDVLEKPENVLRGSGRLLVRLQLLSQSREVRFLEVYEGMERTVAALKEAGFREWVAVMEPSEIAEITLPLGVYVDASVTAESVVRHARLRYGMDEEREENAFGAAGAEGAEGAESWPEEESGFEAAQMPQMEIYEVDWEPLLHITDPAEIEELMEFVSYIAPARGSSLFRKEYVSIVIKDAEGGSSTCYIPKGVLPEKYILRFGELSK